MITRTSAEKFLCTQNLQNLYAPTSDEVADYGTDKPDMGDIYIITSAGGFVQFGWYLGSASNLPTVSTPTVFIHPRSGPRHRWP